MNQERSRIVTQQSSADNEAANTKYHEAQDRMALLPNYYKWIISKFEAHIHGTVVELGVGAGIQISHYANRATRVIGVDYNDELLARLESNFPEDKVTGRKVDLRGAWRELESVSADTVLALDVLEHFQDDGKFLESTRSLLKPGGRLCLKVPAQSELFGEVDKASGHYRRYDAHELQERLEAAGFRLLEQGYLNVLGAIGYKRKRHRKSNYSKTFSVQSLKIINRAIPIISLFDRLPGVKGLSLVGTYERQ